MEEAGEAEVELLRDRRSAPNIGFKQFRKRSRKSSIDPRSANAIEQASLPKDAEL